MNSAAQLYWTDQTTGMIQSAPLGGVTEPELVASAALGNALFDVAVDTGAGKLYWAEQGAVKRQDLVNPVTTETLVSSADAYTPTGIALDSAGGKMYWCDSGLLKLKRANLDGTNIEDLVSASRLDMYGVTLDLAAGKVYWAETSLIRRANLDGTGAEDLVDLAPSFVNVVGLDLDVAGGKMYWTELNLGRIRRANLDGTGVEEVVPGEINPAFLEIQGGKMYWCDYAAHRVRRANLDGTMVENLATGATGVAGPYGIALGASVETAAPSQTSLPRESLLLGNAPNPFGVRTTIGFRLPQPETARLNIYDAAGRLVRALVSSRNHAQGEHWVIWNGRNDSGGRVASGVYFYRLETSHGSATGRMTTLH